MRDEACKPYASLEFNNNNYRPEIQSELEEVQCHEVCSGTNSMPTHYVVVKYYKSYTKGYHSEAKKRKKN
jgi:hypothetical protein